MQKVIEKINNNKELLAKEILSIDKNTKVKEDSEYYKKSFRDTIFTIEFILSSLKLNDDNILIEYVLWLREVLVNIGLEEKLLIDNLKNIKIVLDKKYKSFELSALIEKALDSLKIEKKYKYNEINDNNILYKERKKYLELVLSRNQKEANELVLKLIEKGISIEDIYYYIFELSQKQVGILWQKNELSIADEHYITAVTQSIIGQMYPYIFKRGIIKETVVCMTVEGELHELGIRMIADMLSLDGWDSNYYGANLPINNVIKEIKIVKPKIVILSATLSIHLKKLEKTMSEIKLVDSSITIFVGGTALDNKEYLAKKLGADYYTRNFKEVVKLANQIR